MKKIQFDSISYCQPITGICKQYGIWLNGIGKKNMTAPLVYFQKPVWIDKKQWLEIMEIIGLVNK